jgi:hypothetical protein
MTDHSDATLASRPQGAGTTSDHAIDLLECLGAELGGLGMRTRLSADPGRLPSLHVQNPEPGASALQESIYAAPKADGWAYWWSWAEPVAETPADAARIIARVLRTAETT